MQGRNRPGADVARPQPRTGGRPGRAARPAVRPPTPLRRRLPGDGARRHRRARELLLRTKVPLMSPTQNLTHDTHHTALRRPPTPVDPPAPGRRRPSRWPPASACSPGGPCPASCSSWPSSRSSCWGCCCWPRSRPWFGAGPSGRCSFVTRPRSPVTGGESCWSPPSWSGYRQPWWSRPWAVAGTAGTPTTAGRRCSCSWSWPGPTSPPVASSSRCSSVR